MNFIELNSSKIMLFWRLRRQFIALHFPVSRTAPHNSQALALPLAKPVRQNVSLTVFLPVPSHDAHSCHQISSSWEDACDYFWYTALLEQVATNGVANRVEICFFSFKYQPRYLYLKVSSLIQKNSPPSLQKEASELSLSLGPTAAQVPLLSVLWQELVTCLYLHASAGNCILWTAGCAQGKATILVSKCKASKSQQEGIQSQRGIEEDISFWRDDSASQSMYFSYTGPTLGLTHTYT